MKNANPSSVTATFVSALLSLLLPASAMAANEAPRPRDERVPVESRAEERSRIEEVLHEELVSMQARPDDRGRGSEAPRVDDPILDSKWGPGDPNLAVAKFQLPLPAPPKR